MRADAAGRARQIGSDPKVTVIRADWEQIRPVIMEFLLRQKFDQLALKEKLIDTGDQELIEDNHWHDNYWGDCSCKKCENIPGKNNLGKLLMQIRSCP